MSNKITVTTKEKAWEEVNKIFPTDYEKDEGSSARAGYDIYRHPTLNYYSRICDLGNRLEVLTGEHGETVTNIYIEKGAHTMNTSALVGVTVDGREAGGTMTDFERFIHDRGWEFKTEEALKAGYDRVWKARHGILLSEDEFVTEATNPNTDPETLKAVYAALVGMVKEKKLTAADVFQYARFSWCLKNPEAIVAYEYGGGRWLVNNCATAISEEEAKIAINREWGFEVSRVKIIGTPYYDATDWQYIRFDCAHMTWLWKNGNLEQVYA